MRFNARSLVSIARSAARLLASPPPAATHAPGRDRPAGLDRQPDRQPAGGGRQEPSPARPGDSVPAGVSGLSGDYPGDYAGPVRAVYDPHPDGLPDPGEVVWTWVPYEEDPTQGKDRPVLLIGHSGDYLLALMMTTRDRNNGGTNDPDYLDVGSGAWDRQGRPSEVKLDRVLQIRPEDIRRDGAVLPERVFGRVADALRHRADR